MPSRVAVRRTEGIPSLTARGRWRRYAAGMATEALFILALAGAGFALAMFAKVIWR